MKEKNTIKTILVLLVLLAIGIGIIVLNKFQFSIPYSSHVRMEIYLGKNFEESDILAITSEIYGKEEVIVQKASAFQDGIALTLKNTTEEQKEALISKINEKYETSLTVEDIDIHNDANVRGRDLIRPYFWVSGIAGVLILCFFGIRYYKLGIGKVLGTVIGVAIGTQVLYLVLLSIFRMQINNMTIASGIAILIFCFMYLIASYEKEIN